MLYLDQLDTVKFESSKNNLEDNYVFAQASMMKNILQGEQIVLSQTQIFDSGFILKLLENSSFVNLFEKNVINVAIFHKDYETLKTKDLRKIVLSKLRKGINGNKEDPFYFSGIDCLSNKKIYSDSKKENMEVPRKMAIEIIESEGKSTISDFPKEHRQYFESLKNFAEIINKISPSIEKQNLLTHNKQNISLSSLIEEHLDYAKKRRHDDYWRRTYIQHLRALHKKLLLEEKSDKRSNYYSILDNDFCDIDDVVKIKAIVDFYYNFIVGRSMSTKDSALQELTFDGETLDVVDEEILFKTCIIHGNYRIRSKVRYSKLEDAICTDVITWDNLIRLKKLNYSKWNNVLDKLVISFGTQYRNCHNVLCETIPCNWDVIGRLIPILISTDHEEIHEASKIIDILNNVDRVVLNNIFSETRINEAKARQIVSEIQRCSLVIKGGK